MPSSPMSRFAIIMAGVAVLLVLVMALAGFGSQWNWWHFSTGFRMLRWAAYAGIAAFALSLIAIYRTRPSAPRRGMPIATFAAVLSLLVFLLPFSFQQQGKSVPPIHDITTDTENPPQFVELAEIRADAPNSVDYGGDEVAAMQSEAYPEIQPERIQMAPAQAFETALEAARDMGWEIVAADSADGRIEATDQVAWFGFKDDVVVRLTPEDGVTRVDVRSKSRVGLGDLGVNARRVQSYLRRLPTEE